MVGSPAETECPQIYINTDLITNLFSFLVFQVEATFIRLCKNLYQQKSLSLLIAQYDG